MISFGIFKHFVYHYFLIGLVNGSNNHSRPFEKVDFDICLFTNFCHQNATAALNMKGKVPCCTPCSCSDNCWGLGNCCPDKELIGHSGPELKCALAMVKEPGIKEYNGYNYGIPRYRIVTSCPNEENNKTLADKCAGQNKTSVLDYTWVTDESTGRIFQNEYCARCHNVDRYFKWQIRTTYRSVLSANFSSLPNSIHAPYCELMVELPEDRMHSADNYRCYRANRAKCNITGRWQNYDSDVELACRTYVSPIIDYSPFSTVYKNIYCYYCNGLKAQQFTPSCPDLYKGQRGDLRTSFSALIDFTERQATGISSVCDQHEIFDKFTVSNRLYMCACVCVLNRQ